MLTNIAFMEFAHAKSYSQIFLHAVFHRRDRRRLPLVGENRNLQRKAEIVLVLPR